MTPHETVSTTPPGDSRATAPLTRTHGPQGPTLGDLSDAYLQDYQVRQFRPTAPPAAGSPISPRSSAAPRGPPRSPRTRSASINSPGAPPGRHRTPNRETSALHRMCTLAVHWGWLGLVRQVVQFQIHG